MTARSEAERIAVGIDGSPNSRAALRWALGHAQPGDTITLVHAWDSSPAMVDAGLAELDDDSAATGLLARECARAELLPRAQDVELATQAMQGDPRQCLHDLGSDLLVVGARGCGRIEALLIGSVATHLARHAPCPLVIVPHARVVPADHTELTAR
jgi:nucleotide-binding universal stress UspA family protein